MRVGGNIPAPPVWLLLWENIVKLFTALQRRSCWVITSFALALSHSLPLLAQAGQSQEKPPINVPPAPPSPGSRIDRQSCPPITEGGIPLNATIEAKVGMLESNHQKPGKKLWANSVYEMDLHECRMPAGAAVFGSITAASASKNPRHSELSFAFDAVDCIGHSKQLMDLVVIGVYAPPGEQRMAHDAVPTEIEGIGRQISDTASSTSGYDANLSAAMPSGVKPGIVIGYKNLSLEPQGGPHCSSRLISTDPNLVLTPGTVLLLVRRTVE